MNIELEKVLLNQKPKSIFKYAYHLKIDSSVNCVFDTISYPFEDIQIIMQDNLYVCSTCNSIAISSRPSLYLLGQIDHSYFYKIKANLDVWGFVLAKGMLKSLFGYDASYFKGKIISFDSLFDKSDMLQYQLIKTISLSHKIDVLVSFLKEQFNRNGINFNEVQYVENLKAGIAINSISREHAHVCERQLQRFFNENIGIPPKKYMNILRRKKLIKSYYKNNWANMQDLAYECGYSDAAHMYKDIKKVSNMAVSQIFDKYPLLQLGLRLFD